MAKKQTPFQKTTLHSFFASPDKKQAVAGPSRGVSSSRKAGGSKDQPVELSSSDDDEDCKPGPSVPPPRKRSRTSQAQSLSGIKVEETVVASGVGKAREAQRSLLASAAEASVDDDDKIEPVVIDSSPVLAFDDDGEGVAGFYAVPSPLPKVPSCRDPSPDWPDDADDAKEPFDVDGLPDLVHGGADDELGNLMNDDEQGSQLDPDEDDEELDEVGLGDGDEMARHTGGLGDDGEDEDGSEVECVEAQDGHKVRFLAHALPTVSLADLSRRFSLAEATNEPALVDPALAAADRPERILGEAYGPKRLLDADGQEASIDLGGGRGRPVDQAGR